MLHRNVLGAAFLALGFIAPSALAAPPADPLVLENIKELGKRGGEIRTLIPKSNDTKLLVVYGYARLIGYTTDLELMPDILKDVTIDEDRIFTFHLREGHKWSDGSPFTTEDFRFFWEDVANNEKLRPTGPPIQMLVNDKPPLVEALDERTIRYSWDEPNPFFLPALAATAPLFIYTPAAYMKQFHADFANADELAAKVKESGSRDWAQLFGRMGHQYKLSNPDLPTLQPWQLMTRPPAERFVAERNPYFHRVDVNGVQLPYADRLIMTVVEGKLIPVKVGGGEVDLQARGLQFKDATFLKENEERSDMVTRLWTTAVGSELALYPNLNANDPLWREAFRDVRVRRALSLAIDRHAISQFLYFGIAKPANNSILPQSPLYRPEYAKAYTELDIEKANALLDEAGYTERDGSGIRLLPDGRPMEIVVETAGSNIQESDMLELIGGMWREIGVQLLNKPGQVEVLRNRIFSGETLMTVGTGIENGVPTAMTIPEAFAPTNQIHYQWPKWGQHYETKGSAGEAPDLPEAQQLFDLFTQWKEAGDQESRAKIWDQMLAIWTDNVFTIGTVNEVRQPVSVKTTLANVPEDGLYNWEPGAFFGIYHPDTFWVRE